MTEKDVIFKIYGVGDRPDPNCFCHFGWEGVGGFAFWKYAQAYYDCAEILFVRFKESKGDYATLDGIGLPICFSYRHFIELTLKYIFIKFVCTNEQEYKDYLNKGHDLGELWNAIKSKLSELKKRVRSTVSLGCVEHYIKEFDKFDKSSMTLRYPVNKELKPMKPETKLDIYNLHDRMQELYKAFDDLAYELDNQLFINVNSDKLNKFTEKYEELHPKIETIINEIDSIYDEGLQSGNLLERIQDSETSKVYSILEDCSDDEIILLDTLYYTGRAINSEELRLPQNPYDARTDVKKKCILNMVCDGLEFGKPINDQINIYGKQKAVIVENVRKAMEVLDFIGSEDQLQEAKSHKTNNMQDYGLVSIITPTWACADFIAETIESIQAQTYENWELLIQDDCSADNTLEVVKPYMEADKRIKYECNPQNSGAAITRNNALRRAKGRWIAFLDSDDLWLPAKLEHQLKFMTDNGYHFSYTGYEEIDENSQKTGVRISGPKHVAKLGMFSFCWPGCLTVMYNSDHIGLLQITDIKKNNDYAMWLKVIQKTDCFLLDECLARYRRGRVGSVSTHGYSTMIRWHYKLWHEAMGMNALVSLFWTGVNLVCGVYKKMHYVKNYSAAILGKH